MTQYRLTADQLAAAGQAAFGPRWQTSVAEVLDVPSCRIRGVLSGARRSPPGWTDEIVALLEQRAEDCQKAAAVLKERLQKVEIESEE